MKSDDFFKIGCNTVIVRDGKILLGLRKNCYGDGTWGFPGGHLEIGENLIDGAKRELKEELGIRNVDLEFLSVTESSRDAGHYIQVNFILKNFKGKIKLMEPEHCEEWRFFNPNKFEVEVFPPHKKILESYLFKKTYIQ